MYRYPLPLIQDVRERKPPDKLNLVHKVSVLPPTPLPRRSLQKRQDKLNCVQENPVSVHFSRCLCCGYVEAQDFQVQAKQGEADRIINSHKKELVITLDSQLRFLRECMGVVESMMEQVKNVVF